MNDRGKMIRLETFIFTLLVGQTSFATPVPETVIEISTKDLIGNIKRVKQESLPFHYGEDVARLIQDSKPQMLECLKDSDKVTVQFLAELSIQPEGKATIGQKSDELLTVEQECVLQILSSLNYPKHKLKKSLVVQLPISLRKETL